MADLLETLRATHAHLLEPDDDYLAAAKAERKTGGLGLLGAAGIAAAKIRQKDIPGVKVPDTLFVAVTRRSLILFTPDVVTGRKPKKHVATLALRSDVTGATIPDRNSGAGIGKSYLCIEVRGSLLELEVKTAPARAIADVIGPPAGVHHVPYNGALAALPPAEAAEPPPGAPPAAPPAPVPGPTAAPLPPPGSTPPSPPLPPPGGDGGFAPLG